MSNSEMKIPVMDVDYPDEITIRKEKDLILEMALPEKKSVLEKLKDIYWGPGPSVVFFKCGSAWMIGIMVYLVVLGWCACMANWVQYKEFLPLMAFPILYLVFAVISYWSEEQSEVIELKQTMKCSFSYLISLRMFWASIISVLANIVMLVAFSGKAEDIWAVGAVGISSVFIFSTLSIYLYHRFGKYYHILIMAGGWFVLCSILSRAGEQVNYILFDVIPAAAHVMVAIGCFIGYAEFIRKVEMKNAYTYKCN